MVGFECVSAKQKEYLRVRERDITGNSIHFTEKIQQAFQLGKIQKIQEIKSNKNKPLKGK